MLQRTLLDFSLALLYVTERGNDTELAEVGQLLVNGGNDVALSVHEIADAIRDRRDNDELRAAATALLAADRERTGR